MMETGLIFFIFIFIHKFYKKLLNMIREFLRDNTESCLDLIDKGENLNETDRKSGKSLL